MRTHPVFLCLEGRRCLVLGDDAAARAKAEALRWAGAEVRAVAAEAYRGEDMDDVCLAYASTGDPGLIARLRADAARERVLLNVVDVPEACSFISPAVVARGDLQVAIGTGGASPGLASRLRRDLESRIGPEYAPFVAILEAVRRLLAGNPARADVLGRLLDSPLLDLVRRGERAEVDRLLGALAGVDLGRLDVGLEAPE